MKNRRLTKIMIMMLVILITTGLFAGQRKPFSAKFSNMRFTHSSPSSGTLICRISSSYNAFKNIKTATGTFTVSPHNDPSVYHVFSQTTGEDSEYIVIWRGNFLVNSSTGDITSSYLVVTTIDKATGEVQVSRSATGTGSYDTKDVNSASGKVKGSF